MSVAWTLGARTESPDGTRALGEALAAAARPGDLVLLVGGLGAGKTVFAQGFARGLGVDGPVTSPTFTLVRQYRCGGDGPIRQLAHADLYRLDHLVEVADLALPELLEEKAVALVEWGDVGAPVLGDSALEVSIAPAAAPDARVLTFSARGAGWSDRRDAVALALGAPLDGSGASRPR